MRLIDKCAIITGGARGIGKATALKFLQEGAKVLICDIHGDQLEQTVKDLEAYGEVFAYAADVSAPGEVQSMVDAALNKFQRIDILVNNAGIAVFEEFLNITPESWDLIMRVNLRGSFLVGQAVSRLMVRQRSGSIVNMSSNNGLIAEAGLAHYNSSKAALILLTKTMAKELGPYQIRVNALCPGFVDTKLAGEAGVDPKSVALAKLKIPLGRIGTTDEIANVCAFLASDEASFVTGAELVADGGLICGQ